MTTIEEALAKLPPPWNADIVAHSWDAQMNNDLVEWFDHKPILPSRWVDDDWDADENYYCGEPRKKTLAEFKADVAAYRVALAAWEDRRAKGQPEMMRGYVPSGPPTITVRVTRKDGSRAVIVGDGERWKVTEVWHGR